MRHNIETAMRKEGINQTTLAELMGVTPQAVQQWLKEGGTNPKGKRLKKLASVLKTDINWLMSENENHIKASYQEHIASSYELNELTAEYTKTNRPELAIGNVAEFHGKSTYVPLISWVQAGAWCEAVEVYEISDAEDWLPCPVPHSRHTYILTVKGDSMTSPFPGQKSYPEGSLIYVDPEKQATNGCRVIAKLIDSNEVTFKEFREDGGKKYLRPINPQYPMQEMTDGAHICGVIIFSGSKE